MLNLLKMMALIAVGFSLLLGCAARQVVVDPGNTSPAHESALFQQARKYFIAQKYAEALPILKYLSKRKNSDAQYALGYMYYYGVGVSRDESVALNWMRFAAAKNNPRALLALERYQALNPAH